jgi:calmodulin-binding transcription activator
LTDPTPDFPGSTPADLASSNGQKGISGFLAECSLTSHLQVLNLKEANMAQISGLPGIGDVTERDSLQPPSGDSLGPVRNATQAAARIYQVFRVQSFQRKQAAQYEDKGGMSDERALSLLSVKPPKSGQLDPLHSAATRIQNKFRGWKGRKDFLLIRQRIVKIQVCKCGSRFVLFENNVQYCQISGFFKWKLLLFVTHSFICSKDLELNTDVNFVMQRCLPANSTYFSVISG